MVVYNFNPSIRLTLFNYKQFVLHLNTDDFLKDPNSIKFCCSKYDNSFINNHYCHIITGNLNIVNRERLCQLISKGAQSIKTQNKFVLRKLLKKYKLVLISLLSKYQMAKASIRTIFQNGKIMLCKSHVIPLKIKKHVDQ